MSSLTTLRSMHTLAEAEVVRSVLASEGIDAIISGGELRRVRVNSRMGAYRLLVRADDLQKAGEVLDAMSARRTGSTE